MKSRRRFIQDASKVATGSLLLPLACTTKPQEKASGESQDQTTNEATIRAKWLVGLQLYTLRNQIDIDLPGTISKVAEIGYEHVELFGYADRKYFGLPANDFYKMLQDNGLQISSSHHATGRAKNDSQGTLLKGWEEAIEDALLAGQSHMVCPYLQEEERQTLDQYKELADLLNKAGEKSKAAGIELCYHNHDFEFMAIDGEIPMHMLLKETDPDLVKMELDIYWITKAGGNALDVVKRYPGRTTLWHVKGLGEDGSTVEVGNGTIDYAPIFAAAGESGLAKFFVEQDHSDNPIESIGISYRNVKEIIRA